MRFPELLDGAQDESSLFEVPINIFKLGCGKIEGANTVCFYGFFNVFGVFVCVRHTN